jgi:teichuronopeptide biosynthesis TupA-like protein
VASGGLDEMTVLSLVQALARLAPPELRRRVRRFPIVQPHYDRAVVLRNYKRVFGRPPNLDHPITFNEKLTYKILRDRRPILTRLADKLLARDYVAERIGTGYMTELYQVCRSAAEIDWDRLPRRFVLKANHGNDMNVFVMDKAKADRAAIARRFDGWLATNLYEHTQEWCYRDIQPAILAEELLRESDGTMAIDWKFFTYDGRAEFLQVDMDRFTGQKRNSYDRGLRRLPFRGRHPNSPDDPKFPANIDAMFALADRLGAGLDFIRVDMYNVDGRIVFGEFTNYPGGGNEPFDPREFDELYGSKWRWPPPY